MEKKILAAASYEKQKIFLQPEFSSLPESIQQEVKVICVLLAQKLGCTFVMGFYDNGEIYFETVRSQGQIDFDEIGAELEIKALYQKKAELLKALRLWYLVFMTPEGEKMKEELLKGQDNV